MITKPVKVEQETVNTLTIRDADGEMICELMNVETDEVDAVMWARAAYIVEAVNAHKKAS